MRSGWRHCPVRRCWRRSTANCKRYRSRSDRWKPGSHYACGRPLCRFPSQLHRRSIRACGPRRRRPARSPVLNGPFDGAHRRGSNRPRRTECNGRLPRRTGAGDGATMGEPHGPCTRARRSPAPPRWCSAPAAPTGSGSSRSSRNSAGRPPHGSNSARSRRHDGASSPPTWA